MAELDNNLIKEICTAYNSGIINGIEFGNKLYLAGIPISLIAIMLELHDEALKCRSESVKCSECNGTGWTTDGWKSYTCTDCQGTGKQK